MARIKGELNSKFTMTDLGKMRKILGLRVQRAVNEEHSKSLRDHTST